jgi:hypothetical protein
VPQPAGANVFCFFFSKKKFFLYPDLYLLADGASAAAALTMIRLGWRRAVRELRAVFVMMPELLTELILRAVAARAQAYGVTLVAVAPGDSRADVVILGPAATEDRETGPPVLAVSADYARLLGPKAGDDVALTGDALAARLRDIAAAI